MTEKGSKLNALFQISHITYRSVCLQGKLIMQNQTTVKLM